jgi:hypothetical protein
MLYERQQLALPCVGAVSRRFLPWGFGDGFGLLARPRCNVGNIFCVADYCRLGHDGT